MFYNVSDVCYITWSHLCNRVRVLLYFILHYVSDAQYVYTITAHALRNICNILHVAVYYIACVFLCYINSYHISDTIDAYRAPYTVYHIWYMTQTLYVIWHTHYMWYDARHMLFYKARCKYTRRVVYTVAVYILCLDVWRSMYIIYARYIICNMLYI